MQLLSKRVSQKRNNEIYAYEGNGDWSVSSVRKCNPSNDLWCDYKRYTCIEPGLVCFDGETYDEGPLSGTCDGCCA